MFDQIDWSEYKCVLRKYRGNYCIENKELIKSIFDIPHGDLPWRKSENH